MHRRLIGSALGGLVALGLAYWFHNDFGESGTLAYVGCVGVGMAVGWVASTLFDVFGGSPGITPPDAHK